LTDFEPYVAEPQEPRPRPRLLRVRPLVWAAIVLLVVAALCFLYLRDRAEQDPSLEVPVPAEAGTPEAALPDPERPEPERPADAAVAGRA
jgi:hypothetical protein